MRRRPRYVLWGGRRGDVWVGQDARLRRERAAIRRAGAKLSSGSAAASLAFVGVAGAARAAASFQKQLAALEARTARR